MRIFTDKSCLQYHSPGHPERPFRVEATDVLLRKKHPQWDGGEFGEADEKELLLAHSKRHLERLNQPGDFDPDTGNHEGIYSLARLACGGALAAMRSACEGEKAFSLMRPPGHHAEREQAMGFCYLNSAAVCARVARSEGAERVAVWDFDAHHGNGTEDILRDVDGTLYVSVHQHPCYPGTGGKSEGNCLNFPVAPMAERQRHMEILKKSWNEVLAFRPDLILVSAGFDAYAGDPITEMTLEKQDFGEIGSWLREPDVPVAALLEGGYSDDLPQLIDEFLSKWEGS